MIRDKKTYRIRCRDMGVSAKTTPKTEVEIIVTSIGGCSVRGTKPLPILQSHDRKVVSLH